mmetsp:Transcript_68/g.148  ORF Transcript_68/g.148 Transcript_68/m.148 type:complete len:314 (+) Transcript_68:190-1131(+)
MACTPPFLIQRGRLERDSSTTYDSAGSLGWMCCGYLLGNFCRGDAQAAQDLQLRRWSIGSWAGGCVRLVVLASAFGEEDGSICFQLKIRRCFNSRLCTTRTRSFGWRAVGYQRFCHSTRITQPPKVSHVQRDDSLATRLVFFGSPHHFKRGPFLIDTQMKFSVLDHERGMEQIFHGLAKGMGIPQRLHQTHLPYALTFGLLFFRVVRLCHFFQIVFLLAETLFLQHLAEVLDVALHSTQVRVARWDLLLLGTHRDFFLLFLLHSGSPTGSAGPGSVVVTTVEGARQKSHARWDGIETGTTLVPQRVPIQCAIA